MKKLIVIVFVLLMTPFLNNHTVSANNTDIKLFINGKKVVLEQNIIIENSRVLVPYSLIAKNLGADSNWDSSTKKVTVKSDAKIVEIKIGNKTAMVNGKAIELDVAPTIRNDRTMIPLRFVAESLDYNVEYNKESREVSLTPNLFSPNGDGIVSFEDITYKNNEYPFLKEFYILESKQKYTKAVNKDGYTYAVISYGEEHTGGYDVVIESISLVNGKYYIKSILNTPQGKIVTEAFSYPKAIVKFKNPSQLPVVFDVQDDDKLDISSKFNWNFGKK